MRPTIFEPKVFQALVRGLSWPLLPISLVTVPASVPTSIKGTYSRAGLATLALFPLVYGEWGQIAIPLYQPILAILAPLALLITSSIRVIQRPATIILLVLLYSAAFFFYALNLFKN